MKEQPQMEREFLPQDALNNIIQKLEIIGINYDLSYVKTTVPDVYTSIAIGEKNNNKIQGNGKGKSIQSRISALFELFEHYIYQNVDYYRICSPTDNDFKQLKHYFSGDYAIDFLLSNYSEADNIKFTKFKNLVTEEKIAYPLFLCNVFETYNMNSEFNNIFKYSSNNGVASGSTMKEALIHSINECIERHSIATDYIDVFLNNRSRIEINQDSLPRNLKTVLDIVENETRSKIFINRLKNKFGVYVYRAYCENKQSKVPYIGYGASLSSNYALERALLELLQIVHLTDNEVMLEQEFSLHNFNNLPVYSDILQLNFTNEPLLKNFDSNYMLRTDTDYILETLINNIVENGHNIFYQTLYEEDDICCVHVLISKFEKFHLVGDGIKIIPRSENIRYVQN